ncbi:MAG: hypothetical protein GX316_03245 [Firmicutes bacterium]|nr:hypothetical protein [Bacillota bacterium]
MRYKQSLRWLFLLIILIGIVAAAAGCGPKGFIQGKIQIEGKPLANRQVVVAVSGRTYSLVTSSQGDFEITGVGVGSHTVKATYHDPETEKTYTGATAIKVGIQGAGDVRLLLEAEPENTKELISALQRQVAKQQWDKASQYLKQLEVIHLGSDEALAFDTARGWFYLQSEPNSQGYKKAENYFNSALENGGGAEVQVGLAGIAAGQGRYETAAKLLTKALAASGNLRLECLQLTKGDLGVVLAVWHMQSGDLEQMQTALREQTFGASNPSRQLKDALLTAFDL